jgi:hypothetical protein
MQQFSWYVLQKAYTNEAYQATLYGGIVQKII